MADKHPRPDDAHDPHHADDTPRKAGHRSEPRAGKARPQDDAAGQFAGSKADGHSDGVMSADPRVLSKRKRGDATFPLDTDERLPGPPPPREKDKP